MTQNLLWITNIIESAGIPEQYQGDGFVVGKPMGAIQHTFGTPEKQWEAGLVGVYQVMQEPLEGEMACLEMQGTILFRQMEAEYCNQKKVEVVVKEKEPSRAATLKVLDKAKKWLDEQGAIDQ